MLRKLGKLFPDKYGLPSAAGGFLPNFANPLQAAVGREMAAGVPASQIYIDKSPALKNAANPMGLMVANRRDEPAGGFQGINRARREGANPMMYGAASGFVPNYALPPSPIMGGMTTKSKNANVINEVNSFNNELKQIASKIKNQGMSHDEAVKAMELYVQNNIKGTKQQEKANKLAGQLIESYQKQLRVRQEAVASQTLESQSNRKLAAKIDKALLQYNKSEKTDRDLEIAKKKITQDLNKSSLGPATKTAITSSVGSLATTRPGAQVKAGANRDMLGTVFAVQSGLSVLTGATEGATSSIAKYTNVVADSVGSATSTLFAFQGLATAMPKFAGFLGPAGIAVSGLTALYKIGTGALNEYFGINKIVAQSLYTISKAADEASVNLSKLDPEIKANIEKESKDLLAAGLKTGTFETVTEGSYKEGDKRTFQREIIAKFEKDVSGKLAKDAQNSIAQARGAGVSSAKINEVIQRYSKDALITLDEARELPKVLASLITEVDALAKRAIDLIQKSEDPNVMAAKAAIGKMTPEEISKQTDVSKMTLAERALFAGYQPDTTIEDAAEREKKLIADYVNGEGGEPFKFKNPGDPTKDPFGFLRQQLKLDDGPASNKRLEDLGLNIQRESQTKLDEGLEKERSFKANLGKLQAEIKLDEKLNTQKKAIFSQEQAQKESLAQIENDISVSENDRSKAIAAINKSYGQAIALLTEQEQKTKNIGDAIIGGLTGVPGIVADQIAGFAEQISGKLPEFDINNITEYQNKLTQVFKEIELPEAAIKPLLEALTEAEKTNKAVSDEREKQIAILEKEYGIQIKTINATSDKLSLEKQISAQIEARNSEASFKIENRVLNNAYETLSINKEIERIKRETSLNELQKAEQVYQLELKRRGLESTGIGIGLEQNLLNIDQELINKAREAIKSSGKISADQLKSNLTIEDLQSLASVDVGASEEIKVAIANAQRQRDLAQKRASNEQASLGDVVPDDTITRASEGFFGGMKRGVAALENQTNIFASTLGEKIPQMFSDNMSNAINKMIEGGESFGNILQGAAYEFVKGINQANIQNLSNKFSNFLFKSDGGAKSGIASMLGFASGGKVTGGSGSKDDVPAMLMGGEYVVNKRAVSKYGPKFLEAINNGTLNGYANGGMVDSEKNPYDKLIQNIYEERRSKAKKIQGGNAGFYTPGTYNTGAILGKRDLLSFATQSGTSGVFDRMTNENGYQSIALEPESPMLSVSGMRNSPQFEATQSAKQQAFDLYLQQYNAEIEAKKQAKEKKKALRNQIIMMAASAALGPVVGAAGAGFKAAFGAAKAGGATGFQSFLAGTKGVFTGGQVLGQQVGGLNNLFSGAGKMFSGDFAGAANKFKLSQISNDKQLIDLIQSDTKFAGYIGGMDALDFSGVKRATIVPEPGRFSATRANASIPIGQARIGAGVQYTGNAINLGPPPSDSDEPTLFGNTLMDEWNMMGGLRGFSPINGKLSRAIGGMIPSTSGIDTVPAMLSGGEFVMNRSAVQSIGAPNLQSMNAGGTSITSEETSKELNEKLLAKLDELIGASGSTGNITINVAPSGQTSQETSQDPSASRQQLARQIKDAVLQIINDEKRIGGSLRR